MANSEPEGQSCDVGVLFADVTGSTRIYEMLGDQQALAVVNTCIDTATEAVTAEGGTPVRTIGDELMAVFPTPWSAVSAALSMQRRMDALRPVPVADGSIKPALRVGLHFGKAVKQGNDYFGDTVNVAARVVSLAKAGQILTTGELLDQLPPELRSLGQEINTSVVKGRSEPLRIVQIEWAEWGESKTFFPGAASRAKRNTGQALIISFQTQRWTLGLGHRPFTIGRDTRNDIVVSGHHASRSHATIEHRGDKWLLSDHSTNGTYVSIAGQNELRLHMENFILSSSGVLSCGRPVAQAEESVHFSMV